MVWKIFHGKQLLVWNWTSKHTKCGLQSCTFLVLFIVCGYVKGSCWIMRTGEGDCLASHNSIRKQYSVHTRAHVCVCVCVGGESALFQLLTYLFYHKGHHFSCCSWWDSSQVPRANTCVQPKSLSAFSRGGWQKGNVTLQLSLCNEIYISNPTPKCKLSYHCQAKNWN